MLALVGDVVGVIAFVIIGFLFHGTPVTFDNTVLVAWPFIVALLLGHLAIRSWNAPTRIWPHGVMIWAITLAGAMALRTVLGMGTEVGFVVTTALFLALIFLGWRLVATLRARRSARSEAR